ATVVLVSSCAVTQPVYVRKPATWPENPVPPDRLRDHVVALSETFVPRDFAHTDNLNRTAAYIASHLREAGAEVTEQVFTARGARYRNVIARFGPAEGPAIVVGAHYDTAGELPGADDNASAVAGLIELGPLLAGMTVKHPVVLVAYPNEEPPFFRTEHMGSAVHARSLKEQTASVKLMICLEMIGYFSDEKNSQTFPLKALELLYPNTGNFIALVDKMGSPWAKRMKIIMRKSSPLPAHSINAPSAVPGIDFSDHLNYWAEGYPAVMVTDTSFYRNTRYHTEFDTADTLDYDKMADVVFGVARCIEQFAQ
ncbi:MAG: M28 family peptidase, partial [Verrucomicrobiota bacterium]